MIERRSALRTRLTAVGYGFFYRLPQKTRLRLVRLATPKYTVGAVVLVFDPPGERLLLLRQPPGRGWTLPAGLLNRGETPIQGAVREVAEETGLAFTVDDLSPASPNAVVHTHGRWVDTVFTARTDPATAALAVDGAEVWEAAWHDLTDLPKLTVATQRLLGVYGIGPGSVANGSVESSLDRAAAAPPESGPFRDMTSTGSISAAPGKPVPDLTSTGSITAAAPETGLTDG